MKRSGVLAGACVAAALSCLGAPQTQALELFSGASSAAHADEGMISKVYVARGPRGGVYRGGAYHGVYRGPHGGVYRGGGVYHGGVYRGGAYGVRPGYGYHGGTTVDGPGRAGTGGVPAGRSPPARRSA